MQAPVSERLPSVPCKPYLGRVTIWTDAGVIPRFTMGDRLRKARELTGLDQAAFAREIGVSRNTVGNAETDSVRVRRITLRAWAMRTGVPVEWLETGETPPSPSGGDGASRYAPWDSNPEPSDSGSGSVVVFPAQRLGLEAAA